MSNRITNDNHDVVTPRPSDLVRVSFVKSSIGAAPDGGVGSSDKQLNRLVLVKYFLDRPGGYDIHNSSARIWRQPPAVCKPADIQNFLLQQGILTDNDLLVEVYLQEFTCYVLLDICEAEGMTFDFHATSVRHPGVLNIRLTDSFVEKSGSSVDANGTSMEPAAEDAVQQKRSSGVGTAAQGVPSTVSKGHLSQPSPTTPLVMATPDMLGTSKHAPATCSAVPIGLYAFSLTVLMEVIDIYQQLAGGVDESFALTWGPYAFWISGFLQVLVGIMEWTRNNLYGATAFLAFGCFWLANGTKLILTKYFPDEIPDELLSADDPVGNFLRNLHILAFVVILLKATLTMNRLSTTLISLLVILLVFTSVASWHDSLEWIQAVSGTVVALFAFYVFMAEFLNEIYHKELLGLHPWSKESPKEAFGAAGRSTKLVPVKRANSDDEIAATAAMVVGLRRAHATVENTAEKTPNVHQLRAVQPIS